MSATMGIEKAKPYVIIVSTSEGSMSVHQILCTPNEIPNVLLRMAQRDQQMEQDQWYMGTSSKGEVDKELHNGFFAFNTFDDYSIQYRAFPVEDLPPLDKSILYDSPVIEQENAEETQELGL